MRNIRLGLNFSTSPLPPVPLLGLQLPTRTHWNTTFYLTAQPKDAYYAALLRPQIEFFRSERLILSAYAEAGAGYYFHGILPSLPGGSQVQVGMGAEACLRLRPEQALCLSVGYAAAWLERIILASPSSSGRLEGWDNRNLLSVGLTLALGI